MQRSEKESYNKTPLQSFLPSYFKSTSTRVRVPCLQRYKYRLTSHNCLAPVILFSFVRRPSSDVLRSSRPPNPHPQSLLSLRFGTPVCLRLSFAALFTIPLALFIFAHFIFSIYFLLSCPSMSRRLPPSSQARLTPP